jgi:hypothetical protein
MAPRKSKPWLSCWLLAVCVLLALGFPAPVLSNQQSSRPRRVNLPYFSGDVDESQAAIFWFGRTESDAQTVPGRNYVDVRMAYSPTGLFWLATGIDYYLWYNEDPQPTDDLTQYDALALYLDTCHDRAGAPQPDDYYFLVGLHGDGPGEDTPQYRRQARGTGSGWNTSAIGPGAWLDYSGWQWDCNPGPNSNSCGIDFGWVMGGTIPWSALGLAAPPAQGTVWGMGVLMYDQDNAPGPVLQANWPETFSANNPGTWGEVHFGAAQYHPQPAVPRGNTMIRAASETDNVVEDAWMGGGGECNAGHEGHGEDNHGDSPELFVGSEIQPAHFPCFNKSYLRFALDSVPAGKVIISATLTLHHWGNANPDAHTDSYVWLSSVTDPWGEMTIHWNNAPLAQENYSMTRIPQVSSFPGWPGIAYTWDATQAVAEAYQTGQSVSFAMYDSTTGRDSSKYLTASETGDWNVKGRPRLDVAWGDPLASIAKTASASAPQRGTPVTYTLTWLGVGQTLSLTDTLPTGLSAPSGLHSSFGNAPTYDPAARQITWSGAPINGQAMTVTYTVTPTVVGPVALQNTAQLAFGAQVITATATIIVDSHQAWLPLVRR